MEFETAFHPPLLHLSKRRVFEIDNLFILTDIELPMNQ